MITGYPDHQDRPNLQSPYCRLCRRLRSLCHPPSCQLYKSALDFSRENHGGYRRPRDHVALLFGR